jgi:hypothetical protein
MACIKVETTGKGYNHYELFLLQQHRLEIRRYLKKNEIPARLCREIWQKYDACVKTENIVHVYGHSHQVFLTYLLMDNVDRLEKFSSCKQT